MVENSKNERINHTLKSGVTSEPTDELSRLRAINEAYEDEHAVRDFANWMIAKMEASRKKGRSGWRSVPLPDLWTMLRERVEKGDPVDVANFAMMIHFDRETNPYPPHGWTCFHCGETFTTPGLARVHFGADPLALPGCRIKVGDERRLLRELRNAEAELERYRAEDSDTDRRMAAMASDHGQALKAAEEAGYAKGLEAGLALLEQIEADGLADGQRGKHLEDCPYDEGTRRAIAWLAGWAKS